MQGSQANGREEKAEVTVREINSHQSAEISAGLLHSHCQFDRALYTLQKNTKERFQGCYFQKDKLYIVMNIIFCLKDWYFLRR